MNTASNDIWQYLKACKKPIVLYGMGNGADKIIAMLNELSIPISGLFATDGFVRDKYFHGLKLTSYSELKQKYGSMTVLLCFGTARPEVLENVRRIAAEQELLVPDVPVCGNELFNLSYAAANRKELLWVYNRLADEASRQAFENVIRFKLSGKPEYLYRAEVEADEPESSFLIFKKGESYLDLGAYNGDTVLEFAKKVPDYSEITALEPNPKSFERLKANTAELNGVTLINACATDKCGVAEFSAHNGRGGSLGRGISVETVTVDALNKAFTFIKADVEGTEAEVIRGAAATVSANRPKLQIACYHRAEDLIKIPRAVFDIRNDYRLYLRHFSGLPAWDMYYYFV